MLVHSVSFLVVYSDRVSARFITVVTLIGIFAYIYISHTALDPKCFQGHAGILVRMFELNVRATHNSMGSYGI